MEQFEPKVVCFYCKFGWGYQNPGPPGGGNLFQVPVTCSGKIGAEHVLNAFQKGADGVLILACPEGACHFQDGNYKIEIKVDDLVKTLYPPPWR